jgi:hypothetical protein
MQSVFGYFASNCQFENANMSSILILSTACRYVRYTGNTISELNILDDIVYIFIPFLFFKEENNYEQN